MSGLTTADFAVFEDKQPQQINGFIDEKTGVPVHVAVLMDISGSTAGKLEFEKTAAKDFIYTAVRVRRDQAAFGVFDDELKLLQDFTDKHDLLDKAIDSRQEARRQHRAVGRRLAHVRREDARRGGPPRHRRHHGRRRHGQPRHAQRGRRDGAGHRDHRLRHLDEGGTLRRRPRRRDGHAEGQRRP